MHVKSFHRRILPITARKTDPILRETPFLQTLFSVHLHSSLTHTQTLPSPFSLHLPFLQAILLRIKVPVLLSYASHLGPEQHTAEHTKGALKLNIRKEMSSHADCCVWCHLMSQALSGRATRCSPTLTAQLGVCSSPQRT